MYRDVSVLTRRPIAHRGYHDANNPENSLGAFALAVNNNFYIELDIQLSKDKEIMVFHDLDLERMTGVKGFLHDYTLAELQQFKLANTDYTIPTLKEVLDLVNKQTLIVVELKDYKPDNEELVDKTIAMLREYKGLFVVKSFNPFIMNMFLKKAPDFIRGQLVCSFKGEKSLSIFSKFLLKNLLTNFLSKPDFISTDYNFYTSKIRKLHKKGLCVICWTVRDSEIYKKTHELFDNVIFENFDPTTVKVAKKISR